MKKIILLFAVTALALTFTSCEKEVINTNATGSDYTVSFVANDLPGFDNDLIVVFNSDTLGNLQDAQVPNGIDTEYLYDAGGTIDGELTAEVELNEAVIIQLIDANGDVAIVFYGTILNDVYDGGQNHLYCYVDSYNVNSSSLVGGLTHTYFDFVDKEFKCSITFGIGN